MYSRFGLPDEVRNWESYFYGESREYSSSKRYSRNNGNIREYVETDLSEGDDEMILIQDLEMPQTVELDVKILHQIHQSSKLKIFPPKKITKLIILQLEARVLVLGNILLRRMKMDSL